MRNRKLFLTAILLALPLFAFLLHHFTAHTPGLIPTGFVQHDDVVYVSNARQYLEKDFGLTYSNPFSLPGAPSIYSQPYNYILAFFISLGIPPGYVLAFFGLISAVCCIFFSLKLVDHLYPDLRKKNLVFLLMIWGGGVTAISGLIANQTIYKGTYTDLWDGIYMIDPGNGWWGMNFGRILVIATEAYYHLMFMAGIYLLIRHRWIAALVISFLLAWSHPFSGVEYLVIVCGWLFIEKILFRNQSIPWWVFGAFGALFLGLLLYYLFWLNQFPEHKKLQEVFSVDWGYSFRVFIPAYILVFILAVATMYKRKLKTVFALEQQRLFMAWAILAFLLSNHEWFMKPIQPIHFTRGYIWLGLFLFGLPGLLQLMEKWRDRKWILAIFALLFLSDNILWYANIFRSKARHEWTGHISKDTNEVLKWLGKNAGTNDLLVSNEYNVSYMANAYASSYSWVGHPYNTPDLARKKSLLPQFFASGKALPEWKGMNILVLVNKNEKSMPVVVAIMQQKLYENSTYQVFRLLQ